MRRLGLAILTLAAIGCGDDVAVGGNGAAASGGAGAGGAPLAGSDAGGNGGGAETSDLDDLLARLRTDRDGTLEDESLAHGWPVRVAEGRVVVSASPELTMLAGDFNGWVAEAMTPDDGFAWMIVPDDPGQKYKLTNGTDYQADPWSRAYAYDDFGEISETAGAPNQLQRFFGVGEGLTSLEPRVVRVFVPEGAPTHVLYLHDGQNLFDPNAIWGGWQLAAQAAPGLMFVAIDNTAQRMDEYTQVADDIGNGAIGGLGDQYADYLEAAVRPLIDEVYGEAPVVGVMGSSLGGLISLHIGERNPAGYDFVGSMSGTLGWGSIGPHTGETLIERYAVEPVLPFVVYLDSGGDGPCSDDDADGIKDDGAGTDNYCETVQMRDTLAASGYVYDDNLFHWHEPGAEHNEQAWGARVSRPLSIFASL